MKLCSSTATRNHHDRPGDGTHLRRTDHPETVAKVIARERPDALLPTLGGQTALNVAVKVAEWGVLDVMSI